MKIKFELNGQAIEIETNSDKPLNLILMDDLGLASLNSACRGANCGNCVVLWNSRSALSCLIPAFRLEGTVVQTFDNFQRTRAYRDIVKAYKDCAVRPCPQCYASKTLMIEALARDLESESSYIIRDDRSRMIEQELSGNTCYCVGVNELARVVEKTYSIRRMKIVRTT